MARYQLNIIPFRPNDETFRILFSRIPKEGYDKIPCNFLPKGFEVLNDEPYYFKKDIQEIEGEIQKESEVQEVNIFENKRFSRYYFNNLILKRFRVDEIKYRVDFISSPTIYIPISETIFPEFKSYEKYNLRVLTDRFEQKFSLLVSYEGLSHLSLRSVSETSIPAELLNLVDVGSNELVRYSDMANHINAKTESMFPILNFRIQNYLELGSHQVRPDNKYKENYLRITDFARNYLKPELFEQDFRINSSSFYDIPSELINETTSGSNLLEFGRNGSNFSPYHGLKEFGPFQAPPNSKIKLIFIFHKDDKDTANRLYSYLKKGYKSFAGLFEFVKVPVDIDVTNSISYGSDTNPFDEIKNAFSRNSLDKNYKYAALYISRIKKSDTEDDNQIQYYKIKEFLLNHNITSQVIYKDNIENEYFNFYLPNIAIALLAKLDGKPWRLKRPKRNDLVVGIGAYKPRKSQQRYLGNAFYFQNDGTFHEFDSFTESDIDSLSKSYETSIKTYIESFGSPSRLVIHFYKAVSRNDVYQIEKVLSKLSLNIPIIIVSINKTESSDFILYDTAYDGLMPTSGTYIRLGRDEFLLCNNSRYSKSTGTYIESFPFPLKFRIYSTDDNVLKNNELIRELIDQIYQFSRMYWKSVKQKNLPVTLKYSEIIAEIFSHFEAESLPEFGKKNLWFL